METLPTAAVDYDRSGRHLTAYLSGEIDDSCAPELTREIAANIQADDKVVWLDLADVTFCSSAGITMFVTLHQHIDAIGGRLTLYHPSPNVRRVLEICQMQDVMSIWSEPAKAVPRSA